MTLVDHIMKTRKTLLLAILSLFSLFMATRAHADIRLSFDRTSTTDKTVKVILTDEKGNVIPGASATMTSSHALMPTKGAVNNKIICPNVNGKSNPTIQLTFNLKGLPAPQNFKIMGLDIHAFNQGGGYQNNSNDAPRKFNVSTKVGKSSTDLVTFGTLQDIDIAANVGEEGNVHKTWILKNNNEFTAEGDYQIQLTITTGSENLGCFFGLSEVILTPDEDFNKVPVRPFKPSPSVGNALVCYAMLSTSGKALQLSAEGQLNWTEPQDAQDQIWYFVEKDGGYLMVNMKDDRIYHLAGETETLWAVADNKAGQGFFFLPLATQNDSTTRLTVNGEAAFLFQSVHNAFSRAAQIYEIPCGTLGSNYITRLKVSGDVIKPMQYPLAEVHLDELTQPLGQQPESEFYIYTEDKATAAAGSKIQIDLQLNAAPVEGMEGYIYFDWNRDGIFEMTQKIDLAQQSTVMVTLPNQVKEGKSRVRIRLTDNGMTGADNEVSGQIFDWMLNLTTAAPESFQLQVKANDDHRGEVSATTTAGWNIPCTVKATPKGNATFICWREGLQILSLDAEYAFTLNHETQLVAYFSPKTNDIPTGIEANLAEKHQVIKITAEDQVIRVQSSAKIKKVLVFHPNGQLVAQSNDAIVHLHGMAAGTYIIKVYSETSDETAKILIK